MFKRAVEVNLAVCPFGLVCETCLHPMTYSNLSSRLRQSDPTRGVHFTLPGRTDEETKSFQLPFKAYQVVSL